MPSNCCPPPTPPMGNGLCIYPIVGRDDLGPPQVNRRFASFSIRRAGACSRQYHPAPLAKKGGDVADATGGIVFSFTDMVEL